MSREVDAKETPSPLPPHGDRPRVGILGGGQLGRMIALAARPLEVDVHVFAPGPQAPCAVAPADRWTDAPYDDLDAVRAFAADVDVVTCEFENVPAETAEAAAQQTVVAPDPRVLAIAQDRIREKATFRDAGVPLADFVPFEGDAPPTVTPWEGPGVLKTATGGYDGKGQARVDSLETAIGVWESWQRPRAVLERFVPFESELSVIVARSRSGEVAVYEPFANDHADHILDVTTTPAPVSPLTHERAWRKARAVAEKLEVVGLLCVEMFVLGDGHLLVNEIAPRPHNSGHVTIDACVTSQFEQLLRAILGWPLGSVELRSPAAASANLLGRHWPAGGLDPATLLADPHARLHLYGKGTPRPGRKMGHVTVSAATVSEAERHVRAIRDRLTVGLPDDAARSAG